MKFNEELFMPCPSELHRRAVRDPSQVLVHCETCYPDDSFGRGHVRAGPVVEICSIKIKPIDSNWLKDGKEWQIYGVVQVIDGDGDTYHYFNKEYDDPEIIAHHLESADGLLSLSLTDPVFMPYPVSELKLNLMDRVRNLELAKGTVRMDFDGNSSYEKDSKVEQVMGKDGICSVLFNRFPAAIIAEVFYVVLKEDGLRRDDVDDVVDTYGSIIAECPSNYGGTRSTTLFHAEEDNPVKTEYGTSFELPRSLVVVPAYGSALVIKSSLWGINIDDLVFPVQDAYYSCRRIMISEDRVIQVDIAWVPAYPRKDIKSVKKSCGARPSLDRRVFRPRSLGSHPVRDIMEIFSVDIVSNVDEVLSLHGYVEVHYGPEICCIFEKDEFKCSKKITSVETNGPHEGAFASGSLFLKVDLRDKQGKVFCKGHCGWTALFLEKPFSWSGKRICSIIPCERGFAAIHYSIFTDGIEAQLKFLFSCNDKERQPSDSIINISGTIFSTYGDCDYSTPYQREHYRSVLFSKPAESPLELSLGCDGSSSLRLLKSVVALSLRSSVMVEVDLRAISPKTGSCVEALKGVAEFYVGSDTPWTIQSRDYSITMSIVWY